MKPKFRNIDLKTNEMKYYPKKEELGAIILKLFRESFSFDNLTQKERRQFNFLNENNIIFKRIEGNKVDYTLSFHTKIIINYVLTKKRFLLKDLANKINDSVENISYYLTMFIEMNVFSGSIDYFSEEFILNEEN